MGLVRPTWGSGRVMGMNIKTDMLAILERTGYVAEKKNLFDSMTGQELLRFNRAFFPTWSDPLAVKYTTRLEIPLERPFKTLSLGNRTKLFLLMALAQGADLLIVDEPTQGLDPVVTEELTKILIEDHANEGHTVFLSSQDLAAVEQVADWVGIIHEGKLLLEARLDDIRTEFRRISASGNALPTSRTQQ